MPRLFFRSRTSQQIVVGNGCHERLVACVDSSRLGGVYLDVDRFRLHSTSPLLPTLWLCLIPHYDLADHSGPVIIYCMGGPGLLHPPAWSDSPRHEHRRPGLRAHDRPSTETVGGSCRNPSFSITSNPTISGICKSRN